MNKKVFTPSWIQSLLLVMSLTAFNLFGISQSNAQQSTIELLPSHKWYTWLPSPNDYLWFGVRVNTQVHWSSATFELKEVTSWEGICMNDGNGNDFDLAFAPIWQQENIPCVTLALDATRQTLTASWFDSPSDHFHIKVICYDYGAYGKLKATVYGTSSSATMTIPKDLNGNQIADTWRNDEDVSYDNTADVETGTSGNGYPGDGFSVFEEYRGFRVKTAHKRTDLSAKDVFIVSDWAEGVGDANKLPSVFTIHEINHANKGADNRIDYKGENVHGNRFKQMALWIKKDTVVGGVQGRTGVTYGPSPKFVDWVPYRIWEIRVYQKRIEEFVPVTFEGGSPTPTTISNAISEVIVSTIAHEIGHGIGLGHDLHDERQVDPETNEKAYKGTCIMEAGIDWINGEGPDVAHKFSNLHYDDYKLRRANP